MAVLAVLLVTAVVIGLGYAAFTGHARATFLILLVGSAAAFLLALAAIQANFRGAGDFFECNDDCSAIDELTYSGVFFAPIVFAVALVALLVHWYDGRSRRNRQRRPGRA